MSKKIDFTFVIDGTFDSVNYYRSETPMLQNAMPPATTGGITTLSHADTTADANKTYFVRFGSVKGAIEKLSEEVIVSTFTLFDPIAISSAKIILDDQCTIEKDSLNRVNKWVDRKSGAEFLQGNAAYMPALTENINSILVPVFNNSYMETISISAREMWNAKECVWALCVFKSTLNNSNDKSIFNIKTNNSSIGFSAEAGSPSFKNKPFVYSRINGYADWRGIGADVETFNEWVFAFYEINYLANTAKISLNGTLKTTSSLWPANQGSTESFNAANLALGNSTANANFKFNGGVAAVVAGSGNSSLSTEDRQKLEGWAAHKFGLLSKLPSGHPYKSIAP